MSIAREKLGAIAFYMYGRHVCIYSLSAEKFRFAY